MVCGMLPLPLDGKRSRRSEPCGVLDPNGSDNHCRFGMGGSDVAVLQDRNCSGQLARPKVDDPRDFMSELQYELGGFFVGALAIGSFAILVSSSLHLLRRTRRATARRSLSPSPLRSRRC